MYSETVGSFIRTGDYPLEANYIFDTESDLINFYRDPVNKSTLHKGLIKIVGNQDLYWAVEQDGELYFKKLISIDTLEKVLELKETNSDILDNIKDNKEDIENYLQLLRLIIGSSADDLYEALSSLPYNSLTILSDTLDKFLNKRDDVDDNLDTFKEVQDFLEGYKDTDKLKDILNYLVEDIKGDPTGEGNSLEKLENLFKKFISQHKHDLHNIQTELDQTQIGVGLSGDGSFNADYETYYLQEATSVMNALKILDRMMKKVLDHTTMVVKEARYEPSTEELIIVFNTMEGTEEVKIPASKLVEEWNVENPETSVISLTKTRSIEGQDKLLADVRISTKESNSLERDGNTLYARKCEPDLTFTNGSINLIVNGEVKKSISLADQPLVTPTLTVNWNVLKVDGTVNSVSIAKNLSVERGFTVKGSFDFKWVHSNTKKDPVSTQGICGTNLPTSNVTSQTALITLDGRTAQNVTTYTQTLTAPKQGLMVQGSQVVAAQGSDSTSDSATVTFLDRIYYGSSDNPRSGTKLQRGRASTLNGITTSATQYFVYSYPSSLGALTKITQNGAAPILDDFTRTTQTITNEAGFQIEYYVYTSKNKGAFTNVELKFE